MRDLKKLTRSLIAVFFASAMLISLVPAEVHAETLDRVRELMPVAAEGDSDALEEVIEILERLRVEQPENAKVFAFLGSANGISADQTWNPLSKGEFANLGVRYLDIALEMAPDDWEVRLNRANFNLAVPFFMGRRDAAIDDLVALDRLFRENPTPELANHMLEMKFYDVLMEDAPDQGDWAEGKALAEKHAQ